MSRTNLKDQFNPETIKATGARIVQRSTFLRQDGADKVYRLHGTGIVRIKPDGRVVLDSGGWKTVTTKDRMNAFAPGIGIYADKGIWYVTENGYRDSPRVPYYDGIILPDAFNKAPNKIAAKEEKLRKQIKKFVGGMSDPMPRPDAGDCWLCSMRTDAGKTMGELGDDTEHLLSHIKEGYLHGALIWNALAWHGVRTPQLYWQMNLRNEAKRILRRYLYRKLGLVA